VIVKRPAGRASGVALEVRPRRRRTSRAARTGQSRPGTLQMSPASLRRP